MPVSLTIQAPSDYALEALLQLILERAVQSTLPTDLNLYRDAKAALGLELPGTVLVVTGTNGKGSTIKCLESIYLQVGYRVAATTSPHLSNFTERLTLNGSPVDSQWVVEALYRVLALDTSQMSYFGIVYLALCLCIQRFQAEICLLEVGCGGRLDPNNIYDTDIAVITSIGLDHQALLGPTREAIGREKAHLARAGRPLICGEADRPYTIDQVADEVGANLFSINNQFKLTLRKDSWDWLSDKKSYLGLPIPRIHLNNAACVLQAIECLQAEHPVGEAAIHTGLSRVAVSGRFEQSLINQRQVIFDVAHNQQAMSWLSTQLSDLSCDGQTWCILGMKQDKCIDESLACLIASVDHWVATAIEHSDTAKPEEIATKLATLGKKNCYTYNSLDDALQLVFEQSQPTDRILICGSFFLVGLARAKLRSRVDE